MKKTFLSALVATALVLTACNQEKKYSIDWDLSIANQAGLTVDSVTLTIDEEVVQTVTTLKDGHALLEGTIDEPTLGTVTLYFTYQGLETNQTGYDVIVEPGVITTDNELNFGKGTPLNDAVLALFEQIDSISQAEGDCVPAIKDFVSEHKDDVSSVLVLTHPAMTSLLDCNELASLYEQTSDRLKQYKKMQTLKEKLECLSLSAPGKKFTDFEAEYNGKVQRLSDYVGKGKYVLVDFWASWCGPCRAEIPNLINVYQQYKGPKFEVLGVATWDEPDNTLKAIDELSIPYPQIMNAQEAGSKAYSIDGIPEIILFAPDGTILKRGLRGADIEKAVKEALGMAE